MSPTDQPVAPPPSRSRRKDAVPPATFQVPDADNQPANLAAAAAATPPVTTALAHPAQPADPLAQLFDAGDATAAAEPAPGQPRTQYGAFMGIRRHIDPDADLAPSAPRLPRYVLAAVTLIRHSTGRSQQQIIAEALTGKSPLPDVVLDAAFLELYGYARPPVR